MTDPRTADLVALLDAISNTLGGADAMHIAQAAARLEALERERDAARDAYEKDALPEMVRLRALLGEAETALRDAEAFVGVMHGRGPESVIPETLTTPLGVPVKIGEIMRDLRAVLSQLAASREPEGMKP